MSTEGDARTETREIVFAGIESKSVLDEGSCIGLLCIEALRHGAFSATGLELDERKLGQAEVLAEICGLEPRYLRRDIDWDPVTERFDVVLLLNVLHQTVNPIAVLRNLAYATKQKMFIEIAALQGQDLQKTEKNLIKRRIAFYWRPTFRWLSRRPLMVAIRETPGYPIQTFLMSESLVKAILSQQMTLFHSIKVHRIKRKRRVLLECEKLNLGELIVVAGANSAGKSTLCEQIIEGKQRCFPSARGAPLLSPNKIRRVGLHTLVPEAQSPVAVLHYDTLSAIANRKTYSFRRDSILDLLQCAEKVSIVLVAPDLEVLRYSLAKSESDEAGKLSDWHRFCLQKYDNAHYVRELYVDFVQFVEASRPDATFRIYSWDIPVGVLRKTSGSMSLEISAPRAISVLKKIYKWRKP